MGKINLTCRKTRLNLIVKLFFCLAFSLIFTGIIANKTMAATGKKLYLSDITQDIERTKIASGHILKKDGNDSDKIINLKISDTETKSFVKGITAWASSEVVYDLQNYSEYDYFTAYVGIDSSEQSNYYNTGAKFRVYTSNDGENWTEKPTTNTVFYGWSKAERIKVDLENARYLKLVTDKNSDSWWAEWYDETVFADAKLLTNDYEDTDVAEPVEFIKTVQQYDEELKNYVNNGQTNTESYELALLQREFVNNFGYEVLLDFVHCSDEYKDTVKWLMTNLTNMQLYVYGGEPDGNYIASMKALNAIYQAHKEDLNIQEKTRVGNITYGELYRKMMITVSLTHSAQVALWMQTDTPENQSTALTRYEIFKQLHKNDDFVALRNSETNAIEVDYTPLFESLEVEEMRFVLNNIIDDESIYWLNDYVHNRINEHPKEVGKYLTPHPYMKYIDPDYAKAEFHDINKKAEYDKKYEGVFTKYNVTWRPGLYKLWMNIEGGAVCGGISKIGSNIRGVNGIPSSVISQPGHAALIYYSQDNNGNGYWNIDNDVSGWAQSGKTERLSLRSPLGWGDDDYAEGWLASYVPLAQDAINNFDDYTKSMKYVYLANSYLDNPEEQMNLYRKALDVMPINIDAWYGIIKLYEADPNKTDEQYLKLAEEIGNALKCYPLPMYNLTNRIKKDFNSNDKENYTKYMFRFTLFQTGILNNASTWDNSVKDRPEKGTTTESINNYYTNWVYQPSITQAVAKFLLGQTDTELAKFSFDKVETVIKAEKEGEEDQVLVTEAGVLKLSDRFKDSGVRWDYTLDGKSYDVNKYREVNNANEIRLTDEEIAKITADNDIYVHIVGTNYADDTLYKIDILPQTVSSDVYANDLENRMMGIDANLTEWRYAANSQISTVSLNEISETETIGTNASPKTSDESEWTSFATESPVLKGDVTIEVRQRATGTKLASDVVTYTFTSENEKNIERRYVPVSHLSIDKVSTEATGQGRYAKNAIDGNYNTSYHSDWSGKDTERYMVIKIDRPIYLAGIEYVPGGGGNGRLLDVSISVSPTGEEGTWTDVYTAKNLEYVNTDKANDYDFGLKNIKKFDVNKTEDELKEIGKIQYVKIWAERATNGNWFTARMFNIFENVKLNPHPTAGIEFNTIEPTSGNVVATITNFSAENIEMINFEDITDEEIISEDIKNIEELRDTSKYVTLNEDKTVATFTNNDKYTFLFKNKDTGHIGTATADVTWIDREAPKAEIKYSTTELTTGEVVASLVANEEIIVTNNPHNDYNDNGKEYTFTQNGDFTFEYKDLAGNVGEPIKATVNWINSSSNDTMQDGPVLDPNQAGQEQPGTGDNDNPSGGEEPTPGEEQDPGTGNTPTPGESEESGTGDNNDPSGGEDDNQGTGDSNNPGSEEEQNPGGEQDPGTGDTPIPGGEQQNPGGEQDPSTGESEEPGTGDNNNPSGGEDNNQGTGDSNNPGSGEQQNTGTGNTPTPGEEQQAPGGEQDPSTGDTQTPGESEEPGTGDNNNPSGGEVQQPSDENTAKAQEDDKNSNENITSKQDENITNNSKTQKGIDNSISKEYLPQTGIKTAFIVIIAIAAVAIISIVFYIKYINVGKRRK